MTLDKPPISAAPYPGPRSFEPEEEKIFFGRDREKNNLVSLIFAHRTILVYAASGAGKSSLLRAGIIPRLREEGFDVFQPARVRGAIPADFPDDRIDNIYVLNTLLSWSDGEELNHLSRITLSQFLDKRKKKTDHEELEAPRVLIFDQFEELFTAYPERWRDRRGFFEQIRDALQRTNKCGRSTANESMLRIVFVMREDFIAQMDNYTEILPDRLRMRIHLERLKEDSALAAIVKPIKKTRRRFLPGVAENLVKASVFFDFF